jgi:hypothetical protein
MSLHSLNRKYYTRAEVPEINYQQLTREKVLYNSPWISSISFFLKPCLHFAECHYKISSRVTIVALVPWALWHCIERSYYPVIIKIVCRYSVSQNILYFYSGTLQPQFKRLCSTPLLIRPLDLFTQAFQFGIFNNFCKYFLF